MIKSIFVAAVSAVMVSVTNGECANACNGHGRCTSYDMCVCNRNWLANDCSERICQFGLAHVDTPKGDLNMDGKISGPDEILIENSFAYPFGTSEQFPRMQNSDLSDLENSAHYYMECSNKGVCDRQTGTCNCFDGYDGAACQRASCPGYPKSCSGHGVCKTIRQLANADYENIYELWDKDSTMGCECDAGFFGPDCSQRECKFGIDPLYFDDTSTIKYSIFNFAVMNTATGTEKGVFTDGMQDAKDGYWQIRFFDMHGEDWLTAPLVYNATCAEVVAAINALPNDVIPGTMDESQCSMTAAVNVDPRDADRYDHHIYRDEFEIEDAFDNVRPEITQNMLFWLAGDSEDYPSLYEDAAYTLSGCLYRIHFTQNPGKLREPKIEIYLDGKRPSLTKAGFESITKVWTDGNQGENVDYFADHCDGVTTTISYRMSYGESYSVLDGLTDTEKALLKTCLSDSDFISDNNVDTYNWDYGSEDYPHLIKLVLTTGAHSDGGHYAALIYNPHNDQFRLLNPITVNQTSDVYEIYTTKGTFARASNYTGVAASFASNKIYTTNETVITELTKNSWNGDLSCETLATTGDNYDQGYTTLVPHCLNKSDIITFLSVNSTFNPDRINLYTIEKLHQEQYISFNKVFDGVNKPINFGAHAHVITTDLSTNFAYAPAILDIDKADIKFYVYKFFPSSESSYNYVAQCSNRGICNVDEGLCECFGGYTGDSCSTQNSLAV